MRSDNKVSTRRRSVRPRCFHQRTTTVSWAWLISRYATQPSLNQPLLILAASVGLTSSPKLGFQSSANFKCCTCTSTAFLADQHSSLEAPRSQLHLTVHILGPVFFAWHRCKPYIKHYTAQYILCTGLNKRSVYSPDGLRGGIASILCKAQRVLITFVSHQTAQGPSSLDLPHKAS